MKPKGFRLYAVFSERAHEGDRPLSPASFSSSGVMKPKGFRLYAVFSEQVPALAATRQEEGVR